MQGLTLGQSAKYQIKVQGRLREGWSDWFDDMIVNIEQIPGGPTITTLSGIVQDQAALHGLLNRIRDLSIPLLSVQLIDPTIIRKEFLIMKKGILKMKETQNKVQNTVRLVLKAVAVGMSVASVILGFLGEVDVGTQVTLLGIGLFALALVALQNED
jgi:hypothetical protein